MNGMANAHDDASARRDREMKGGKKTVILRRHGKGNIGTWQESYDLRRFGFPFLQAGGLRGEGAHHEPEERGSERAEQAGQMISLDSI